MISNCLHPLLWNLHITADSLNGLQDKWLDTWVFEQSFSWGVGREELYIEFGLFRVDNSCGSEVADVVAQPCRAVVTAFERTNVGVFMSFESYLEGKIIGLTSWIGQQDLKPIGQVSLQPFNIISKILMKIPGMYVDRGIRFLHSLEHRRIRMPHMSDIVVKIQERFWVIGCIVVAKRRSLYLERFGEWVVERCGEVLDSLLENGRRVHQMFRKY